MHFSHQCKFDYYTEKVWKLRNGLRDLRPKSPGDEGFEEEKKKQVKVKEEDWGRWEERHKREHRKGLAADRLHSFDNMPP